MMKSTNALHVTLSFSYFQGDLSGFSILPSFVEPSQSKYIVHSSFLSFYSCLCFLQLKETCVPIAKRKHPLLVWNRKCSTLLNITAFKKPEVQRKKSSKWKLCFICGFWHNSEINVIERKKKCKKVIWFWLCYGVMSYLQNDIYNIEHLHLCWPYMIQKLTFHLFSFPLNAVLLEGIGKK